MNDKDTYKVTSWLEYGTARIRYREQNFRWYWQANMYSWMLHHILGYSCNTWRKNDLLRL